jgi:hypothetical protein
MTLSTNSWTLAAPLSRARESTQQALSDINALLAATQQSQASPLFAIR